VIFDFHCASYQVYLTKVNLLRTDCQVCFTLNLSSGMVLVSR
jgi:ABC-type xylose transport system permease subunit